MPATALAPAVHGLSARTLHLDADEAALARRLRDAAVARYLPADALELAAIEAMVVAELKLARLDGLETACTAGAADGPLTLRDLDRYRGRVARDAERARRRLEQLVAERPPQAGATAAQLRHLAELLDRTPPPANDDTGPDRPAADDDAALDDTAVFGTNEPDDAAIARLLDNDPALRAEVEATLASGLRRAAAR